MTSWRRWPVICSAARLKQVMRQLVSTARTPSEMLPTMASNRSADAPVAGRLSASSPDMTS
jgi:hypothetical protein